MGEMRTLLFRGEDKNLTHQNQNLKKGKKNCI